MSARTFVAHVRYASTGGLTPENTHPFEQEGRRFAHNGVIGDLPALERELGDVHDLLLLERDAGGAEGSTWSGGLEHAGATRIRVSSDELAQRPAVVVATERMDDDPGRRPLSSGELLHVDGNLGLTSRRVLDVPPAHQLSLSDLGLRAAASQAGDTQ